MKCHRRAARFVGWQSAEALSRAVVRIAVSVEPMIMLHRQQALSVIVFLIPIAFRSRFIGHHDEIDRPVFSDACALIVCCCRHPNW